jgi:hypothetical protein
MPLKRYNFIHSMSNREVIRLMFAVFLLFGTHGPAFLLANSVLSPGSWTLLGVRTFLAGSFSACIILAIRKPWLGVPIAVAALLAMISGEQVAGYFTGKNEVSVEKITQAIQVSPEEFDAIRERRLAFYGATALLVGCSWAMMSFVLNAEGKKRGRLEAELSIAGDIQRSLLPDAPFRNAWCSVSGLAIPTSEVGGDYFDVVPLSDERVAIFIADVSGHGTGAGIVSAMTKSALHAELVHDPAPSSVMARLNNTLVGLTETKTFVTCAYALLDHRKSIATLATAGHPPILLRRRKALELTEHRLPNLALGLKTGLQFKEEVVHVEPGDLFCLYTDGIVEASNRKGEQFGAERLKEVLVGNNVYDQIGQAVIVAARTFSGVKEFADDATIVTIALTELKA